jgi:2-polyprenyl-3-methyl-5-hydroxy-6-metoxy-1,4-benzoquinol methylase
VTLTTSAAACVACGSRDLSLVETIAAIDIVEAWRREDHAVGADDLIELRANEMLGVLPKQIQFVRCARCGLEMAAPAPVWSATAYPRDQSYPIRWEFPRTVELLGSRPMDVLELGCGTGEFLALAAAAGHRAVGIDFSGPAVEKARTRGLLAVCGGFDALQRHIGADLRFDAVAFFQLIEHIADPDALLAAVAPWMRETSRLFLSTPGPRRFTRLIVEQQAGRSDFWDYPPHHVLRWTLPALSACVERHGWRVETAIEEPLSWVAAGSQIGMVRALYGGHVNRGLARRISIGVGWLRLLAAASTRPAGVSLYLSASRG